MKQPILKRIVTRFRGLDRLSKILIVAFLLAATTTAVLAFSLVRGFVISTTSFQLPGVAILQGGTDAEGLPVEPEIAEPSAVEPAPWDGSSRVNILVMGLDYRDWEAGNGPPRTDSMMVFTFDPVTKKAGMLSIPRDLWVDVPGFGHYKINTAYQLGESARLPGGGAGLAVKTVEQFLGVTINYYAQIDFGAFERFIDTIGGVKITLEPYEHLKVQLIGEDRTRVINGGTQTLNGAYALAYARARHTEDGDFARAQRQQELILALRNQILRPEVQALLLTQGFQIYQDLSSGINTNMTLPEIFSLAWAAKGVKADQIVQAVIAPDACRMEGCIGKDYVTLDTSPDGLSILKPVTENIRLLRDQVFSAGTVRSLVAQNTEAGQLVQMEAAQLSVNNGANVPGLADSARAYLEGLGFVIASTGNSDPVGGTTIIDYTGNPYTVAYLVELFGVAPIHIFNRYDPNSAIDVEIIVGPGWAVPAQ